MTDPADVNEPRTIQVVKGLDRADLAALGRADLQREVVRQRNLQARQEASRQAAVPEDVEPRVTAAYYRRDNDGEELVVVEHRGGLPGPVEEWPPGSVSVMVRWEWEVTVAELAATLRARLNPPAGGHG